MLLSRGLSCSPLVSKRFLVSSHAVGLLLHAVQVERQRAVLLAVDTEAEEESTINRELANVMCTRLDAARRATERLLGVLQVCSSSHSMGSNVVYLTHRSRHPVCVMGP